MGMIIAVTASKGTPNHIGVTMRLPTTAPAIAAMMLSAKPPMAAGVGALLLVDDGGGQYEARDGEHIHKCTGEVCHEQAVNDGG